jgi:cysteinyl-tRNA synthetase
MPAGEIRIHSTRHREKVPLETLEAGRVRMYVCGPTVYDSCHIGHARPAVCFDAIRRFLEYDGYAVTFISNITDIDDKIIARAAEIGVPPRQLAQRYQDEYERDMARLGVRCPTIRPKATEHIPAMIELIETLMAKGAAYTTERGVWFDVTAFPAYGQLSGRTADDETTEHRVEEDPQKRHRQDFALWKAAKPGEPAWESPWGPGRPGWHIECSAMSGQYCDFQLDIHGGGADLAFPHHENEVAQSEAATGKPFVRYWLHNGFITVRQDDGDEAKMGKSKGNAFWLKDVFAQHAPAALRLWVLGTHYRQPLTYSDESLATAAGGLDRLYNGLEGLARALADAPPAATAEDDGEARDLDERFRAAMRDDFNTAQALAVVYDEVSRANRAVDDGAPAGRLLRLRNLLQAHLTVLGLPLARPVAAGGDDLDAVMQVLIDARGRAREEKQFAIADLIRDELGAAGYQLADRPEGTTWTTT